MSGAATGNTGSGAAMGMATGGPPLKKARGSSGLPRGVSKTTSGKFQARAPYTPPGGTRAQQRNVGTFETVEEAEQAAAVAKANPNYWTEAARKNEHKRGQVR